MVDKAFTGVKYGLDELIEDDSKGKEDDIDDIDDDWDQSMVRKL